ncbi:hypothetical protein EB796_005117 [Bugula neritina]|uniref:Secreted protein n=1 Tax=Bugula neritina TaxID=10212 RepID=A0A7J7KEF4_BUGNE|nr:hypothetical protein EB796_005117 [Bugula neritina]
MKPVTTILLALTIATTCLLLQVSAQQRRNNNLQANKITDDFQIDFDDNFQNARQASNKVGKSRAGNNNRKLGNSKRQRGMANRRRNKGKVSTQNDSGGVVTNQVGGLTNLVITESESRHNAEETIRNTNAEVDSFNDELNPSSIMNRAQVASNLERSGGRGFITGVADTERVIQETNGGIADSSILTEEVNRELLGVELPGSSSSIQTEQLNLPVKAVQPHL